MSDDLKQLLDHADAACTVPPVRSDLAGSVRRRLRRRRLRSVSGCVLLVLAAVGVWRLSPQLPGQLWPQAPQIAEQPTPAPQAPVTVEQLLAQREQFRLRAEQHERIARHMIESQRQMRQVAAARRLAAHRDSLEPWRMGCEDAARSMVLDARRRVESAPTSATETYHRAIELFPDSVWATIARQQLQQLLQGSWRNLHDDANDDRHVDPGQHGLG